MIYCCKNHVTAPVLFIKHGNQNLRHVLLSMNQWAAGNPAPKLAARFRDRLSAKWSWAQLANTFGASEVTKKTNLFSFVNLGVC
jgi:hypothetical protein